MNTMTHHYKTELIWDGNEGTGTSTYTSYGRQYRVLVDGKPDLLGSADPTFRGDAEKHNPEDLFVAAISACHMLTYLALCARNAIRVVDYRDDATATMVTDAGGGGRFEEVHLHPIVTIADAAHTERALALHERAHALCFIANSCSVPIHHTPEIRT
jgi:organic hydroperoxide reductase OsmC/OhrA